MRKNWLPVGLFLDQRAFSQREDYFTSPTGTQNRRVIPVGQTPLTSGRKFPGGVVATHVPLHGGAHGVGRPDAALERVVDANRVWEIDTGYYLMLTEPGAVADMLLRLAPSTASPSPGRHDLRFGRLDESTEVAQS